MRKRRKLNIILILFVVVLLFGLGYAYLTTTLSINGTTDVDSNTWNVYWDNVQVTDESVTGEQVTTAPTIDTNKTTVSFQVRLSKPGDFYEFTVDAVNDGTIDAMVDSISKTTDIPEYLDYTIAYSDGTIIESKHLLSANKTEEYKVRVEYKKDIEEEQLPKTTQSISLSFGVEYVQADNTAIKISDVLFTTSTESTTIGSSIPAEVDTYTTYQEAITAFGYPIFIKNKLRYNNVASSYLGFIYKDNIYYLQGAGGTFDSVTGASNYDSKYYEKNKEILLNAFGDSYCKESVTDDILHNYQCIDEEEIMVVNIINNGDIYVGTGNDSKTAYCYISRKGQADCTIN